MIVTCREAEALGFQLGQQAAAIRTPKLRDPDWQMRDIATANFRDWAKVIGGAEMGAFDVFCQAFNKGLGRSLFGEET